MFLQLKTKPSPPGRMASWGLGWDSCAASTKERPERSDEEFAPFLCFLFVSRQLLHDTPNEFSASCVLLAIKIF